MATNCMGNAIRNSDEVIAINSFNLENRTNLTQVITTKRKFKKVTTKWFYLQFNRLKTILSF